VSYHPFVRAGVSFASAWQVSSLTAIFASALLTSPSISSLLSSVRAQLAKNHQICHDVLTSAELSGRVEFLPASAGLWANAKVILKDGETTQDVVAKAKEKGVIIGPGTEFNMVKGESGWIKLTFALPEERVQKGMERLKSSLL
jgi:DNA-binding transcriptional MocR family regulator